MSPSTSVDVMRKRTQSGLSSSKTTWPRSKNLLSKEDEMTSKLLIASLAIFCASIVHAQPLQELPGADLIVFNAEIFTGNLAQPEASALAVKDGRIYSVGSDDDVLGLKNSSTEIIDAGRRRLIPGISD